MNDRKVIAKLREVANLLGGNTLLLLAAARLETLKDSEHALALMVSQYCSDGDGGVTHLCMEAGERAFEVLGLDHYASVEVVEEIIQRLEEEMRDNHEQS